jgi:glycosyltransferase involved in cell wall biosynthesis
LLPQKKYTLHVGFSGFPDTSASVQRVLLTFKGLQLLNEHPLVINKISHYPFKNKNYVGKHEGVPFIYTSILNFKPTNFAKRNLNKVSGYFGELKFLFKKRKQIKTLVLYSTYFAEYPYYFILSKLLGSKLLIQHVEMFSSMSYRSSTFTKLNDQLIEKNISKLCHGVIAISDVLKNDAIAISSKTPVIKIPAMCDFDSMAHINKTQVPIPYLMYCGSIGYIEVVEFIIEVFEQLCAKNLYNGNLLMVISGQHTTNWQILHTKINGLAVKSKINIKSNIPREELITDYKSADMLLIPLRQTIQDAARFPHKIGEYTASKRPIVTTNVGEIKNYFTDGVSAIVVNDYSVPSYVAKIGEYALSNEKLNAMGNKGFEIGLANFDYKNQAKALQQFIQQL